MTISLSRDRLVELLERAQGKRIVVIGDAMLDSYLVGEVDRISPEAPVPVVRVRERRHALGGAANVAQNVHAVGCQCDLVSVVGADTAGTTLTDMLAAEGMATDSLLVVDRPTTQKTRIIARSQQLLRVDEEHDDDLESTAIVQLRRIATKVLAAADAVVLEDYNKGVLVAELIEYSIKLARQRNIPIIVDPKYRNFFSYRGATIFKPNRRELEAALGASVSLSNSAALPAAVRRLGVDNLLLTLGEGGMVLLTADGQIQRVRTVAREVYDVVGAGDTVTAYLAATMAAGATPSEAALVANVAAGIEVGKLGAATVRPEEILAHLLHADSPPLTYA